MKIFKKSMSLLLTVLLVFSLAVTAFAEETTATLGVTASKTNVTVGDEFSVYLNASDDITGIFTFQMDLYYDTEMFKVVSIDTKFESKNKAEKGFIRFGVLDTSSNTVISKGKFGEVKFKVLKTGDYHFQLTTCKIGGIKDGKSDVIMNVATAPGAVNVTAAEAPAFTGYAVSASEDKTVAVGENAEVKVAVSNSGSAVTAYNAYDLTMTYDTDKLTYVSCTAADENAVVTEDAGTIRVIGFGGDKTLDTAAATLTFQAKGVGDAEVKLTAAKVDIGSQAVGNDAPAAFLLDDTTVIKVTGYTVTLGEGLSGASTVAPGADYTFTATDPDNYDYVISATMGGETVTPKNNGNGTYTVSGVTGNLVINAAMTPKSYNVTVEGTGAGDVSENAATATYKTDYTFKLTKADGCNYTVTVTAGGNTVTATATTEGVYTISGADIKGELIITVEKTAIVIPTTTITITGDTDDVQGGLILTAKNGEDTTFKINKKDGYTYTVKAGDTELTVGADGTVTIPGSLLTGAPLTVTVTKTAVNPYSVEVYEYVKLDGQSIWLVVAKSDSVLAYGADTMFTSEKYGGYCWLVISAGNADTVKTEAIAAVKAGSGTAAAAVYTGDVNGTGNIDVNDAQLVYNIYNTEYASFDALSRAKFLAADVNGDHTVTVLDAAAVVNTVLGK